MRYSLLLSLVLFLFVGCTSTHKPEPPFEFIVLQINDVYEIGPLDGGKVGGVARVATLRNQLLKENPNVITVLSGDFLSPSLIGTLKKDGEKISGAQMVDALNALGLDYVTFGNHEFDLKEADLQRQLDRSEFVYTSCNTFHRIDSSTTELFTQNGNACPEYIIHEFAREGLDPIKVGLVGVLLPFNKKDYVHYTDVDEAFVNTTNSLKDSCHTVLGITHLEMDQDRTLAGRLSGVPLLLGGHDHENMIDSVGGVRITKADANAKTVYVHRFTIDPTTGKTSVRSELVAMDESVAFDPVVDKVVQGWLDLSNSIMVGMGYAPDQVLFTATDPLEGRESFIRNEQTNLGSLIADAMLDFNSDADASIMNSGSIRVDDVLEGDITQFDILRTLPFGGKVGIAEFKGDVLIQTLNIGLDKNKGLGGYLQIRNLSQEEDQSWSIKGEPIDPNKTYRIAAPDFLMSGGEANLPFLGNVTTTFAEDGELRNDIRDIVIAYSKKLGEEIESQQQAKANEVVESALELAGGLVHDYDQGNDPVQLFN